MMALGYSAEQARPLTCPETEAALLGSMMIANQTIDYVLDRLTDADFAEPANRAIFQAIAHQHSQGRASDPVTLRPLLLDHPALDGLGFGYVAMLTGNNAGLIGARDFVATIADLAARRRLIEALDAAREATLNTTMGQTTPLSDIIEGCDAAVNSASNRSDNVHEPSAGDCVAEALADQDCESNGVTCGQIPSLDNLLGDLRPGNFIILGARPSMGKTATALSYAIGAARKGHGTLFVSLEMSSLELGQRMAADVCFDDPGGVPFAAIRKRRLTRGDRIEVERARDELGKLPLRVIDVPTMTTARLNMMVRRHKRRMSARGTEMRLVIVDYLQLLAPDDKTVSQYEAISRISRALKAIAKEQSVAVLALAQLNRQVEARADKRPMTADLRDSGQLEQDADAIVFLFRPEHYLRASEPARDDPERIKWESALADAQGRIEFIVPKCRNGVVGTARGQFYGQFQAVRG